MAPMGKIAVWFTAAALVSFNLQPLLSLHRDSFGVDSLGGSALGGGHAIQESEAGAEAAWALPQGQVSLRGRQLPILFLAIAGDSYTDFMLNWAASAHDIRVPYVLAALDAPTLSVCIRSGLPYIHIPVKLENITGHLQRIRALKAALVRLVRQLLEERAAHVIVVCDTDIVWLRSPLTYLQAHPLADIFVSTDCLSAAADVAWEHAGMVPRPGSLAFLLAWEQLLTSGPEVTPEGWVVADQVAFNILLEQGTRENREVEGALRTLWYANGTVKLHPLPTLHFANGHVAFVQRLPERYGIQPTAIHATFQHGGASGKRNRFREFGLWRMDPDSYYEVPFLSYDNGVRGFIQRYAQQYESAHRRPMANFHRHLLGMAWQLASMRDALALARTTDRTLVLPTLWCWCDRDMTPTVLENCTIEGSDLQLPFACPADFIVDPNEWDKTGVAYRLPGFLDSPRVARAARTVVQVGGGGGGVLSAEAAAVWNWRGGGGGGDGAALGMELRGMRPAAFGGFDTVQAGREFDKWWDSFAGDVVWCCAGAGGAHSPLKAQAVIHYAQPRPLATGWAEWQPPVLQRPDWCETTAPENLPFTKYENHPCTFLQPVTS